MENSTDRLPVSIEPDPYPPDPRAEFDPFGRMVCWHPRYQLGDPHDWPTPAEFRAELPAGKLLELPVFLHDHSGLTISTEPFPCPWDSGQIGWIFREKSEVLREFSRKRLSQKLRSRVFSLLRAEIADYDSYLRGDVWTITVTDARDQVRDSVSGVIGYQTALDTAQEMLRDAAVAWTLKDLQRSSHREQHRKATASRIGGVTGAS